MPVGTRFIVNKECNVHDNFKQLIVNASEQDTLYSHVFDGMKGRVLKTKAAQQMMQKGFPLFEAFKGAKEVKEQMNLSYPAFLAMSFKMLGKEDEGYMPWIMARQAVGTRRHLMAISKGDVDEGILFAGQNVGGINDVPSVKELVERTVAEAEAVLDKLNQAKA
jgi:NAD(P)H-dependent flavin oxidoreductase YrpB (nitropropane dioxygenase family)